jgi:hypothetical protein
MRLHEDLMQSDPIKRKVIISDLYKLVNETREYASQAKILQLSDGVNIAEGWEKTYEGYIAKIEKEAKKWSIELDTTNNFMMYIDGTPKEKEDYLRRLHVAMKGKRGKKAIAVLYRALDEKLNSWPKHPHFEEEFGHLFSQQTYSKYRPDEKNPHTIEYEEYMNIVI